jgi:hypothetical protein
MGLILAPFPALVLAGCGQMKVAADYDSSADFAALHTYAWRPGPQRPLGDPRFDGSLIDKRVRAAVDRVLASKGFRAAASGAAADFFVGYDAVIRQRIGSHAINGWYGYGAGRRGAWRAGPQTVVRDYEEGTLLIDVIDPATMQLLWRGSSSGVVDPHATVEKREQRINDAVEWILADFPPR